MDPRPRDGQRLVARARRIAETAHAGQLDKAGQPYIGHPARVAGRLQGHDEQAVGWLHDVVEDTGVTLEDLRREGFGRRIVDAVDALSRREGEGTDAYYARVCADELAVVVKLADVADNSDPQRLAALDEATAARLAAKYAAAEALLRAAAVGDSA